MNKFMKKFSDFMIGRYGVDDFFYFIMFFLIITGFIPFLFNGKIFTIIRLVLFAIAFFRYFSKNISARAKENALFLKVFNPVKKECKFLFTRIKNIKQYRYRRCPRCHQQLRLPVKKGKHTLVCPKCNKEFTTRVLF